MTVTAKLLIVFLTAVCVCGQACDSVCVNQLASSPTVNRWLPLPVAQSHALVVTQQCGSRQNRFVQFANGRRFCVLYRRNLEQVASEVLSHRLAQLVGIQHVPPLTIDTYNSSHEIWKAVAPQLTTAGWKDGHPLLFVPYLEALQPVHFPQAIVTALTNRSTGIARPIVVTNHSETERFTELIVFDYLTCNTDRTVSNLHSLQWNDETLSFPVRNAYRNEGGSLVLLDNESGMLHGYRLLNHYGHYLERLLASSCVFRPQLITNVDLALLKMRQEHVNLHSVFGLDAPNSKWPASITRAFAEIVPTLKLRLSAVRKHFEYCVRYRSDHDQHVR